MLEHAGLNQQQALFFMFPGVYAMASFFFCVVIIFVGRDMRRARKLEAQAEAKKPLLDGDNLDEFAANRRTSMDVDYSKYNSDSSKNGSHV